MSSSASLPVIEKLMGRENYSTWKFAMKAYLQLDDLWEIVEGTVTDEKRDKKALSKIILMIDTINYSHVNDAKSAKEAWKNLESAFEDSGLTRKVGLLKQLITTQLVNCKSVDEYVDKIITTAHKLNNINFEVKDEWIGTLLLAGLPDEYRPMIMGLESSGLKISSDLVKVKILQDVKPLNNGKSTDNETALYTKRKPFKKFTQHPQRCFVCNKIGHFAAKCYENNKKGPENKKEYKGNKQGKAFVAFCAPENETSSEDWYIDSCASTHITGNRNWMCNIKEKNLKITVANNTDIEATAEGTVPINVTVSNQIDKIDVKETLYVPNIVANLLSVNKIVQNGYTVLFDKNGGRIMNSSQEIVATATEINGVYKLDQPDKQAEEENSEKKEIACYSSTKQLWHRRLGHLNRNSTRLLKTLADGTEEIEIDDTPCKVCVMGKQSRQPFNSKGKRATKSLELVHTDLCGPMENTSIGGSRYVLTFIDDYSRKVFAYFLKTKDEVEESFDDFKAMTENQTGNKIKTIRSDNGTEYINRSFSRKLKLAGIRHQLTAPYTPQQNGIAERMNRSLVEKARTMLIDAKLPKEYWAEAMATAVYLKNRSPTKVIKDMTPEEAWSEKRPNLKHLKIFGTEAMVHIPKQKRQKWDAKSKKLLFMGYCENTKGYRFIDPNTKVITVSRDVKFLEDIMECEEDTQRNKELILNETETEDNENTVEVEEINEENETVNDRNDGIRHSTRTPKPKVFEDYVTYYIKNKSINEIPGEPQDAEEALSSVYAREWQKAMDSELEALKSNNTYLWTDIVADKKVLNTKWVFKVKQNNTDNSFKFKARLVVKGCGQTSGIDFQETYSPVVKYSSLRYLFSLAAKENLEIDHMDVTTAYLHGNLEEEIYVAPPKELSNSGKIWLLKKSMYGLKQSGRCWNQRLNNVLSNLDLTQSKADPCIYHKRDNKELIIVAVYVDDLLIFSTKKYLSTRLKSKLEKEFDMKNLGAINSCLGMNITRDRHNNKIWIDQTNYIQKILEKFNMADCKPISTPMEPNTKLLNDEQVAKDKVIENVPYQEAVGSLLYLSQISRPDICFTINTLSQFNKNPKEQHWVAIKRVFRYLKGTINRKLEFSGTENDKLECFSDADWGNQVNDRHSITGSCVKLQGGLISWFSKKQKTVALSTTEAEYIALSFTVQEVLWLRELIRELDSDVVKEPVQIYCDNNGAIQLAKNSVINQKSKHIDIRYHFIKEHVENKNVIVNYLPSEDMLADLLTKPLCKGKHDHIVNKFGLL